MLFQHSSELALRAALFLAQQVPGKLSPVHEIAAAAGVSEAYLAKILQRLTSNAFLLKTTLGDLVCAAGKKRHRFRYALKPRLAVARTREKEPRRRPS